MKSESGANSPFLTQDDQPVSFAELFFDLVFVFAITQVVHLMHGYFDVLHIVRAVLVFWLVWWAWTQYSWALNAANTNHRAIQIAILVATAVAFFMAVSIPQSFGSYAHWFSLAYVTVRGIGLLIYLWVTWPDKDMRNAVRTFSTLSIAGLCSAVAGGFINGQMQYILWGLTILLDLVAASLGGRSASWKLHPRHFSERHGLFVIIALGETLIIAASAVSEAIWNGHLLAVSVLSVGITCCMWWLYFYRSKERLEIALSTKHGADKTTLARDVYSLLHFPLMCGLIIYAYAIEQAMLFPKQAMTEAARLALAAGIAIFSIGIAITHLRADGKLSYVRILITVFVAVTVYLFRDIPTFWTMAIALTGLMILCIVEEFLSPHQHTPMEGINIE
jgi:low temperature requirement protein LtrA